MKNSVKREVRQEVLKIACPKCKVAVGDHCVTSKWNASTPHRERIKAAVDLVSKKTSCN